MGEKVILVTGFGPFGEHKVNASWEAVKLLKPDEIEGCRIVKAEIPVTYKYIEDNVPELWQQHKPDLVVHVGVSKLANAITIETQAFRSGYKKIDCQGCRHSTGDVCDASSGDECITTNIDVDQMCKKLDGNDKLVFTKSVDAGRYLCEYIFYKSLHIDSQRTLFIHVPTLNNPYSAEELAKGLERIIRCALGLY